MAVVAAGFLLARAGAPIRQWGFEERPSGRHLLLALGGVAVILAMKTFGLPLLAGAVESGPVASEFGGLAGNLPQYLTLLLVSWTFAAFGEEIAFRVVMLRGVTASLGGSNAAAGVALVAQALVFGCVHYYNGGALAVVRTAFNGLVYGALVLASRGVVWPAVLAHGLHNSINLTQGYLADGSGEG